MELIEGPAVIPPPVRIDYSQPVIDLDAMVWPFQEDVVTLAPEVCYIDSRGDLHDAPRSTNHPFVLSLPSADTVLGHLTDDRVFVSSRSGITAFEARQ